MVNQSIVSDLGVVLGIIVALVSLIIIILKIGEWNANIKNWIKKIDNWRDSTDEWKDNTDKWKNDITISMGIIRIQFSNVDTKLLKQKNEEIGDFLSLIPITTNPISAEEKEKFNYYREKAVLEEGFTIEEYRNFKYLTEKFSNELPENKKEKFDILISDLLKFILSESIEKIEKSSPAFIKGYIIQPGANLKKVNLRGENLQEFNLQKVNLERADLREANLRKADLRRANLSGADLSGANLEKSNLIAANLQKVDLQGASLSETDLRRANLEKANLTGAKIDEISLESILKSNNWLYAEFDSDVEKKLKELSKQYSTENNIVKQEAIPRIAIPDNYPIGIISSIMIDKEKKIKDIMVWVDITHTYIGDLTVDLISPNGTSVRLHDRQGGSRNNINITYVLQDTPQLTKFLGENVKGEWILKVADYKSMDVGNFNKWGLELSLE